MDGRRNSLLFPIFICLTCLFEGRYNACSPGFYGKQCTLICGFCLHFSACDPVNGSCLEGCSPGYAGNECKVCDNGYKMTNCTDTCGHCDGKLCRTDATICPFECINGKSNATCKEDKQIQVAGSKTRDATFILIGFAGTMGILLISALCVFTICMCRRRYLLRVDSGISSTTSDNSSATVLNNLRRPQADLKPRTDVSPQHLSEISLSSDDKIATTSESQPTGKEKTISRMYGDIQVNITGPTDHSKQPHRPHLRPSKSAHNLDSRNRLHQSMNAVRWAGAFKNAIFPHKSVDLAENSAEFFEDDTNVVYNSDTFSDSLRVWASDQMDTLQRSLLATLSSVTLKELFQSFPNTYRHPATEGMKIENQKKNRFRSLRPYDHSRVKLHGCEDGSVNDYINASFIKGYNRSAAYIAMQGPLQNTVNDVWLMVWQQNITQIVILTKCKEDGKDKCATYWPEAGSESTYGLVTVACIHKEERAHYLIRAFSLKFEGKPFKRQVDHYHFVKWPEHGLPTACSLVNFWRNIKARAITKAPLLVHCSSGVGRTGVFIALDIAMDMSKDHTVINVESIVKRLREDRPFMVQAEAHYKFLYEVILEAYTFRSNTLTLENMRTMVTGIINVNEPNPLIDKEFQLLQQMGTLLPKPKCMIASRQENLPQNRNLNALPDDNYLVCLSPRIKGNHSYINAVYLSSFKQWKGIILTQLPLPDTLVDIWHLVDDQEIKTIVSIGSKDDTELNSCRYWPISLKDKITAGPYSIKLVNMSTVASCLTSFIVQLQTEKSQRLIQVFQYSSWPGEVPDNTLVLIQLVEKLNGNIEAKEDKSPVLVQCIDGAAKSGLFCIVWDILSRAKCDHEIDVYMAARQVQMVRPQAISSQVQYRYCYKAAQYFSGRIGVSKLNAE